MTRSTASGEGKRGRRRPNSDPDNVVALASTSGPRHKHPDALTPSASRFAFLAIIDLVAAATGYAMGPLARENLRRIKFNLVDKGAGRSIEPLGD